MIPELFHRPISRQAPWSPRWTNSDTANMVAQTSITAYCYSLLPDRRVYWMRSSPTSKFCWTSVACSWLGLADRRTFISNLSMDRAKTAARSASPSKFSAVGGVSRKSQVAKQGRNIGFVWFFSGMRVIPFIFKLTGKKNFLFPWVMGLYKYH